MCTAGSHVVKHPHSLTHTRTSTLESDVLLSQIVSLDFHNSSLNNASLRATLPALNYIINIPLLLMFVSCRTQDPKERIMMRIVTPVAVLLLGAAAALPAQQTPSKAARSVPLFTDLGTLHHPISSKSADAQKYFDQGMRLVFAFNHGEAIRAFTEAARLDPSCAICYWGIALAYGPHVNAEMDSASAVQAYAALQKAKELSPSASEKERAYITALTVRYAQVPRAAERANLDSAYAATMGALAKQYPDDLDALTLYAEARMDLRPWNYWQPNGQPYQGTQEIVDVLERVIARDPNHPGACHYYIHAVEAVAPAKAVPCAERLAKLMPGAGHLVHMPAHIYIRVGRWNEAIDANVHAVHTDETYIAKEGPTGVYPIGYYPHNYHFLSFAQIMAGRSAEAIATARTLVSKVPVDIARAVPLVSDMIAYEHIALVKFGRWADVLALPVPPEDVPSAYGLAQYARGVAFAATGKYTEAAGALANVERVAAASSAQAKTVLDIASHALAGEIAARRGDLNGGLAHLRLAQKLEDGMLYFEPPPWPLPVRPVTGAVLLRAGKAAEAEQVYREDLARFPENGWSLFGLAASLRAQGKTAEANAAQQRFERAWSKADVKLTASTF
jgi:tetratricopeptide (TPR) repeat protein